MSLLGIPYSEVKAAHYANDLSVTDTLSLTILNLLNLFMLLSSPIVALQFSHVFTHFFEETARIGRKVKSNGLITDECAEFISRKTLNTYIIREFLILMITLSYTMYVYLYRQQMSVLLNVDYEIANYLFVGSIPTIYIVTYPPSMMFVETSLIFSTDFTMLALKRWREEFQKAVTNNYIESTKKKNESNQGILLKSRYLVA